MLWQLAYDSINGARFLANKKKCIEPQKLANGWTAGVIWYSHKMQYHMESGRQNIGKEEQNHGVKKQEVLLAP